MLQRTFLLVSNSRTGNLSTTNFSLRTLRNIVFSSRTLLTNTSNMPPQDIDSNCTMSNEDLLSRVLELVKIFEDRHQEDGKVANYLDPADVPGALGGLEISKCGVTPNQASNLVDNVWKHSIKTQHKHFYNALYHGVDTFGMAGGLLSEALNTNGYSHEVAPVFSAVEKALIQYFGKKFGWEYVDGLTTPGGSISNMYVICLYVHYIYTYKSSLLSDIV